MHNVERIIYEALKSLLKCNKKTHPRKQGA